MLLAVNEVTKQTTVGLITGTHTHAHTRSLSVSHSFTSNLAKSAILMATTPVPL